MEDKKNHCPTIKRTDITILNDTYNYHEAYKTNDKQEIELVRLEKKKKFKVPTKMNLFSYV